MSGRLYRLLLYAYPARLREEFGADMVLVFEQQLTDAHRHGGLWEVVRVWSWAVAETVQSGLLASFTMVWCGIGALSVLGSSALFLLFLWAAGLARHCVK